MLCYNYNSAATCDDGSCLDDWGCMDPLATNYDPLATCPDNCIYPPTCEDPAPTLKQANGNIESACGTCQPNCTPGSGTLSATSTISFFVDTDQGVNYDWTIIDNNGYTIGSGTQQSPGQSNVVTIQPLNPSPATTPANTQYYIDVTDNNGYIYIILSVCWCSCW
jgi:hypothetical protein